VTTTYPTTRPGLRWLVGGLTAGILAATLVGSAIGPTRAQSDSDEPVRSISVSGLGRVKVEPDVADISLGVTKQGEDAQEAAGQAATTMDALIKTLLEAGIAENDIQTTTLSLNPIYDWDETPPEIEGWEARNLVRVTVRDITAVGEVVDAATAAGATDVNGISFRVEDPSEAESTARSAAVAAAEAKADQLATDAGVTIIGVISISESGGQPPQPVYLAREAVAFDMAASAAPTPVLPGELEVSVSVFIQYEIE
jgi:hypothetical protein